MATSGSTDWTLTRNEIIHAALRKIGCVSHGNNATAEQISEGAECLNRLVKSLQNDNIFLWATEWITKTFSAASEVTGTDSNIYTCIRNHTSATANKPITGADYSTYWYQRNSTGGVWATSTAYTSLGNFDVDSDTISIEKAFLRNASSDSLIDIISYDEYMNISDKYSEGVPYKLCFFRSITPKIYLYPQIDDTDYVLHYLRIRMLEDFDSESDNPDFPVRWIEPLVCGLAYKLSYEYGLSTQEKSILLKEYTAEKIRAKSGGGDSEIIDSESIAGAY